MPHAMFQYRWTFFEEKHGYKYGMLTIMQELCCNKCFSYRIELFYKTSSFCKDVEILSQPRYAGPNNIICVVQVTKSNIQI